MNAPHGPGQWIEYLVAYETATPGRVDAGGVFRRWTQVHGFIDEQVGAGAARDGFTVYWRTVHVSAWEKVPGRAPDVPHRDDPVQTLWDATPE